MPSEPTQERDSAPQSLAALERHLLDARTAHARHDCLDAYGPILYTDLVSLIDTLYEAGMAVDTLADVFQAAPIADVPHPSETTPFAAYDPFMNQTYGEVSVDQHSDQTVATDPKQFPVISDVKRAFEREYVARIGLSEPDPTLFYEALSAEFSCTVRCDALGTGVVSALKEVVRRYRIVMDRLTSQGYTGPDLARAADSIYSAVRAGRQGLVETVTLPVRDVLLVCGCGTALELVDIERGSYYPADDDPRYAETAVLVRGIAPFEGRTFAVCRDATCGTETLRYTVRDDHAAVVVEALSGAVVSLATETPPRNPPRTWQVCD